MDFNATLPNVPATWANNRLHFFKYMSEETAIIVLGNRTLRWSTAATLNDPFEMQLNVSLEGIDVPKVKDAAQEKMWSQYSGIDPIPAANPLGVMLEFLRVNCPGMSKNDFLSDIAPGIDEGLQVLQTNLPKNRDELLSVLSPIKILSLTEAPDIGLMWAHYANAHKGVVLRFRSIPALDSPYGTARPMIYTDERPALLTESYLINSFAGLVSLNTRAVADAVIYTKMSEWAYEREWRISSGDGRNKDAPFEDIKFGLNELDGVIFGLRTSAENRAAIRKLSENYPNVEFMEAIPVDGAGKIAIQPTP